MTTRVTTQDIADALGLSRNTVSKALNNTRVLSDSTREQILKKAIEMGSRQFSYSTVLEDLKKQEFLPKDIATTKEIALFTTKFLGDSHFSSTMLDNFQREISEMGYSLSIHRILKEELKEKRLPNSFDPSRTSGIICYEVFDYTYSQMICSLDIPVLFVDSPVVGLNEPLKADRLYMDNTSGIYSVIQEMVRRGKTQFGFVGEILHCQSFWERYMAFKNALFLLNQPYIDEYCMIENNKLVEDPSTEQYREYLFNCFQKLQKLPEVLICVNDFIALDTIQVLNELGFSIPKDLYICGFDDSPESKIVTPTLTTIHIHTQIMGFSAVHLLMSRIKNPTLNYRTIYTETSLIYRKSTDN